MYRTPSATACCLGPELHAFLEINGFTWSTSPITTSIELSFPQKAVEYSLTMALNSVLILVLSLLSCASARPDLDAQMVAVDVDITSNMTKSSNFDTGKSSAHQHLELAPAFPIIAVSTDLILAAISDTHANTSAFNSTIHQRLNKRGAEPCGLGSPCPDKS